MTARIDKKRRAYQFGRWAEWLCILWLMAKGYRILAHRYKSPLGEIDIIARSRDNIICIEVKARARQEDGRYAVSHQQQQRIIRASQHFMASHAPYATLALRFDVMVMSRHGWPAHIKQAFDAS